MHIEVVKLTRDNKGEECWWTVMSTDRYESALNWIKAEKRFILLRIGVRQEDGSFDWLDRFFYFNGHAFVDAASVLPMIRITHIRACKEI